MIVTQMTSERDMANTYGRVRAAFGPNAHAYTTSPGHSDAHALAELVARVSPQASDRMLDIGTGAGHTALAFASAVRSVVAYDLTPEMLDEVRRNAAARGITNLTVRQGAAESLPFPDASFDIVACRMTTHHFAALPRAVGEMARVLAPGGRLLIVDTMVPEDDALDREINEIEWLRDPSHVRNYRPSEWRALVEGAGLTVRDAIIGYHDEGGGMDFAAWTSRIGTPPDRVAELRTRFTRARPELADTLKIVREGDTIRFALPRLTLVAVRP